MRMLDRAKTAWSLLNDALLNIRTVPHPYWGEYAASRSRPWEGQPNGASVFKDNVSYSSADYWYTYKLRGMLGPGSDDVLYDIGCGKGRVVCVFARRPMRRCVGIELLAPLCEQALENAGTLRGRRTPIAIRRGDACETDISDGTIYYLFNPFGRRTMERLLENIERSLQTRPRAVRIAYHNAVHAAAIDACGWLEPYFALKTRSGLDIRCWRSR